MPVSVHRPDLFDPPPAAAPEPEPEPEVPVAAQSTSGVSTDAVVISSIRPGSLASQHVGLVPGLLLEAVQDAWVLGEPFGSVLGRIKASSRPLRLTFRVVEGGAVCFSPIQAPSALGPPASHRHKKRSSSGSSNSSNHISPSSLAAAAAAAASPASSNRSSGEDGGSPQLGYPFVGVHADTGFAGETPRVVREFYQSDAELLQLAHPLFEVRGYSPICRLEYVIYWERFQRGVVVRWKKPGRNGNPGSRNQGFRLRCKLQTKPLVPQVIIGILQRQFAHHPNKRRAALACAICGHR
jgi:hypothetical protein